MSDRDFPDHEELMGRSKPGSDFAVAFGRTVQVLRTEEGWSRAELAERAGISYSYLSAIENGTKPPSGQVQHLLAGAFGLRAHELMAQAEARLSPTEPEIQPAKAIEVDRAAPRRALRARKHFRGDSAPMAAAAAPAPKKAEPDALRELRELLPSMSAEDTEFLLEMARRLAGRG